MFISHCQRNERRGEEKRGVKEKGHESLLDWLGSDSDVMHAPPNEC